MESFFIHVSIFIRKYVARGVGLAAPNNPPPLKGSMVPAGQYFARGVGLAAPYNPPPLKGIMVPARQYVACGVGLAARA